MITTIEQLLAARLGDYRVITMSWTTGGENFVVVLSQPASEWVLKLVFVWATQLLVRLDFGESFGEPLLFETSFNKSQGGTWEAKFDFAGAPNGGLSLCCNEIIVQSLEKETYVRSL